MPDNNTELLFTMLKNCLSEKEMHDIAVRSFERACERYFRTEKDCERIIGNISYIEVQRIVDECAAWKDTDTQTMLKKEIQNRIKDLNEFIVFNNGDLGDKVSKGYEIINEIITEEKPAIREKVKELSEEYIQKIDKQAIEDAMMDVIHEALFGENGEDEKW